MSYYLLLKNNIFQDLDVFPSGRKSAERQIVGPKGYSQSWISDPSNKGSGVQICFSCIVDV